MLNSDPIKIAGGTKSLRGREGFNGDARAEALHHEQELCRAAGFFEGVRAVEVADGVAAATPSALKHSF